MGEIIERRPRERHPENADCVFGSVLEIKQQPPLLISIHAIDRKRQCNNYDGLPQPIAEAMSKKNGYPAVGDIGYPVPGSLGNRAAC